jgi:signal transduction histidine kinase
MKRLFIYIYLYMLVMFLAVNFGIAPVFNRAVQDYFQRQTGPYWHDLISGPYHIIETDLERLPVEQWGRAVEALQRHFAFPIDIEPMDAGQRSEAEALALRRGEIVVQGAGESFKHQIGHSGLILRMGPMPKIESSIPDFKSQLRWLQALFCVIIVVSFFAFALIWTLPFARNLNRISSAAASFGQGALDARAKVSKRSSLSLLADAFNRMADRIQELITSHKELTHTVSHELRTPLARIRFSMEMMASAVEPAEREKHHDEIRRNVDELDMLVSELLTYARFDRRSYHPQTEVVELGPWLKELTAAYNDENDHIRIDCRINSPDPKVPAQVNPRMLERAVHNLLQNAARHTRQRIHVTLETTDNHCLIHVDDDGAGVAVANRRRIFEPFVRLDHAEKTEAQGYGLGLAIVQRVAQWHDGQATVENAPIGGARFTIRWQNPFKSSVSAVADQNGLSLRL